VATTVRVVSNANLTLSNSAAITGNNAAPLAAGNLNNRLSTGAAVTLDGGTVALVGSTTAAVNQTVASIAVANDFNRFNFTAGAGQSANLTVPGNLTLAPGATAVLSGAGLQTTAAAAAGANNFVVNGTVPTVVNGLIPGLYGTTTVGGPPTDF